MLETVKSNKWKIVAILIAAIAIVLYLLPKKEIEEQEEEINE